MLAAGQAQSAVVVGPVLKYKRVINNTWLGSALIVTRPLSAPPMLVFHSFGQPFDIQGVQLSTYAGLVFWRFDIQISMGPRGIQVQYSIDVLAGARFSFYIPGQNEEWRWAFTSCNGFCPDTDQATRDQMGGIEPLWRDLLNNHNQRPFSCMVGGGDQVYADEVWELPSLKQWLAMKGKENRYQAPWNAELDEQVSAFYFEMYRSGYTIPAVAQALASIPSVNMLDDHDVYDGFGSYPEGLQNSNVFSTMAKIARHFYMLFQHHTTMERAVSYEANEYIGSSRAGFTILTPLGPSVELLAIDCRAERTRNQIVSEATWEEIFSILQQLPSSTKHLVVVTGVPIVYPRFETADNMMSQFGDIKQHVNKSFNSIVDGVSVGVKAVLGSSAADGLKSGYKNLKLQMGKSGLMKGLLNQFGEPELSDDLIDHWTNELHEAERHQAILRFQQIAAMKGIRITFIAGDVHCGGAGRFFGTKPDDFRTMYQIVSSAIGNIPPPVAVLKMLHKNAKVIHFDHETKEEMLDLFKRDVNGHAAPAGKKLINRRNYCLVDPAEDGGLNFNLMVENEDWKQPAVPYPVHVPRLS